MDRAIDAGGFASQEYVAVPVLVEEMKRKHPDDWRKTVFILAVNKLLPKVGVNWEKGAVPWEVVFSGMAELTEREAEKLEAPRGRKRKGRRGPKGPRYDQKQDKQIFDGWKASGYRKIEDYARKKQGATTEKEIRDIRLAIDREKHRRSRKRLK